MQRLTPQASGLRAVERHPTVWGWVGGMHHRREGAEVTGAKRNASMSAVSSVAVRRGPVKPDTT
jgi:hypothetical protein